MSRIIYFTIFIFILTSCSSKKNVYYFQNIENNKIYNSTYEEYLVKPDDILKIDVYSEDTETVIQFNPSKSQGVVSNSKETMMLEGYVVNSEGQINFPGLGNIKVSKMTLVEVSNLIQNSLSDKGFLNNHSVQVKILNQHFTILGEVNAPGKIEFLENDLNIIEAIGMAGDLTIFGKRDDIKLIREVDNKLSVFEIDLTSDKILSENNFQIMSGDIIIVNPNNTRVKNAGIIGNSGTLISLLSFLLSVVIITSN